MRTVTLILLIFSTQSFCQPVHKSKFPLQQFTWENSNSVTKYFGNDLLQKTFTDHSNRALAQLYRYSDSSFVYEQFDTLGRIVCKGILANQFEYTDTIDMPDMAEDPTGTLGIFKDTVIPGYEYGKHGFWMERANGDTLWNGNYVANKKSGLWKRSREVDHTRFPQIDTVVFYREGVTGAWELPSTLDSVFARIKGNWYNNAVLSSKYYLFIQKDQETANQESDFNFLQKDSCYQLYVADSFWPESREYMQLKLSFLKKKDDWLIMANDKAIYQLLDMNNRQIILKRL